MLDAIKPLLDSDLVNEDTRQAIAEQWEAKLVEAKETVRSELREEFAQRYEHDKTVMVEALDKMVTEDPILTSYHVGRIFSVTGYGFKKLNNEMILKLAGKVLNLLSCL